MAYQVVWTKRAIQGFDKIIEYIWQNFTEKEVIAFLKESNEFIDLLKDFPGLLQKSNKVKDVHRGPINKLTIVAYRVKRSKNQIELLNFKSSRQKPLKTL